MINTDEKIIADLNRLKRKKINDNGDTLSTITIEVTKHLAQKYGSFSKKIELIALSEKIIPLRYQKNMNTITVDEQIILLNSSASLIGCGGLGGHILELLVRMGIGEIIIADGDRFMESNLNRQLICTEKNLGESKVESAIKRAKRINSGIIIKANPYFINSKNINEIIRKTDVAIDALDNISSRFTLERACRSLKIPLIHGAVEGFNGQVSTIFPQDKGFELIYGSLKELKSKEGKRSVSVIAAIPALVASFQVGEVVNILLKKKNNLRNKLLYVNLEEYNVEILNLDD